MNQLVKYQPFVCFARLGLMNACLCSVNILYLLTSHTHQANYFLNSMRFKMNRIAIIVNLYQINFITLNQLTISP